MIRLIGYFFGIGTIARRCSWRRASAIYVGHLTKDLPDYEVLASYEPPVTTRVHASDGALMGEFARERRLYLPIQAVPGPRQGGVPVGRGQEFLQPPRHRHHRPRPRADHQFPEHGLRPAPGRRLDHHPAGRQELPADRPTRPIDRKIKEMILAFRIEQAYSKDRILELYLNEIFFGLGAYGIAGAALTYFDKSVNELTVAEAAYLAALPKGPSNYHPFQHTERAIERRNWVIDQMVENGYVTREEGDKAKAEPLGVKPRRNGTYLFAGEYFTEEVRREIISRYGENALYEGGLSVRTTLDPKMQLIARKALQNGLIKFDTLRGYRGPVDQDRHLGGDWGVPLGEVKGLDDVPEWRLAVVLDSSDDGPDDRPAAEARGRPARSSAERETGTIAKEDMSFAMRHVVDGKRVKAKSPADVLKPGDVVFVEKKDGGDGYMPAPGAGSRAAPWWRWTRIPAACWPWSAASPIRSPSSTAPPRRCASRARRSSRSSMRRRSTMATRRPRWSWTRRSPSRSATTTWTPKNYDGKGGRPVDAAHRHRALAQPDDGAAGQRHGHEAGRRICRALRRLRPDGAVSRHGAGLRRDHGHAHGLGLFGDGQWRPADQAVADRPHPGPLRQDRLQA